jgi:hypothetical protein
MPIHGKNTNVALGQYDITRSLKEVSADRSFDTAETTCFDEPGGAKTYVLGGQDATFSWSGIESGKIDSVRSRIGGIADLDLGAPFTVGPDRGFEAGRIAEMGSILSTGINISSPVADVVSSSGDFQADGPIELGKMLTTKADYSAASVNGASVDLGAPGIGARLHYHVVANGRNGLVTLRVQHSANNSTWVDYDTFTVPAGQLDAISRESTTALQRYARVQVILAGSAGAVTARVAIARRGA